MRTIFKLFFILIIIFTFSIAKDKKFQLKGYIYDGETGVGIADVQIYQSDSTQGVVSDNNGFFILSNLPEKCEIVFDHVSYQKTSRPIHFNKQKEIFTSFYLYSTTLKMDSVIVMGNPFFPGRNEIEFSKIQTLFTSKRYRQYKQMLKKENWSWLELVTYGLWSIADEKVFNSFWELKSRAAREQFLQIFWQNNDPTPETAKNELKEEFERRIRYNWTHFSKVDSFGISSEKDNVDKLLENVVGKNAFQAESETRLRPWTKRAPWDARGEIHLKYGLPTRININNLSNNDLYKSNFDFENWYYADLGVDFLIEKYTSNIRTEAIRPGERIAQRFQVQAASNSNDDPLTIDNNLGMLNSQFRADYIDNRTFHYQFKTKEKIPDFELSINRHPVDPKITILIEFTPEYFKSIKSDDLYSLISVYYYITDSTGQPIIEKSLTNNKTIKPPGSDILKLTFSHELTAGQYQLFIKADDHNANQQINRKVSFTIQ